MALAATVYLCAVGKKGLRSVAESTVKNTQYAMKVLTEAGCKLKFPAAKVFGEFVLELPMRSEDLQKRLIDKHILAGLPLGDYYSGMENCLLVALTETKNKEQIDRFASEVQAAISG